jgi:(1->4)-alpha-D-glucan 1-alpha-D-glucosylmutase
MNVGARQRPSATWYTRMPPRTAPPSSTYRLQFNHRFTFADAERVVPYLDRLGVSDLYASPYLMAQPGSMHGYDICDHRRLNPEVGTDEDYESLVEALRRHRLGQLLDFVPNHMGIDPDTNPWWRDVLENGQSSAYARFFDIDWDPVKPELKGKVLLPVLGDQYGLVLERGEMQLRFEGGGLRLDYFEHHLPINPRSAVRVFEHGADRLEEELGGEESGDLREFLSVMTALRNLPGIDETRPERVTERRREKEVARERLTRLADASPLVRQQIERAVAAFNGTPGDAASFDRLHALLEEQPYRLSYWRTASHEINYRRFFDINALAALRMEDEAVFAATHELIGRLLGSGAVTGLRIDHPDGLYDPAAYFDRLQQLWQSVAPKDDGPPPPLYIVAEKILSSGEELPADWAVAGTTGYQFANDVNGVLVDAAGERPLRQFYARYTKRTTPFGQVVYESKRLIAQSSLASELNVLAHALNRISESSRRSRDFTLESLRALLQEVVACFPVYRTYVGPGGWTAADRERIETAVARARWRNPAMESSVFDFFREVVLPRQEEPAPPAPRDRRDGYPPAGSIELRERLAFSMQLQQYTAPVQAKGLEDTAFYRHNVLVSLNEVGGAPARFGRSLPEFHAANLERAAGRPLEMTATATHDTKLGEDVRARITTLAQVPGEWRRHVAQWTRLHTPHRTRIEGEPAPDRSDEYRFYQVLVGAWPTRTEWPDDTLVVRLRDYMTKAVKEAKVHTSWINDNEDYDRAVVAFVERVLTSHTVRRFLSSFLPFQARIALLACTASLSQLVLKLTSPGVPDTYQGSELWDLRLVDPDNRAPVDFGLRERMLDELDADLPVSPDGTLRDRCAADRVGRLLEDWEDGRIKLWITACGLRVRRSRRPLFQSGRYVPLAVDAGALAEPVAFARVGDGQAALTVAPRLLGRSGNSWAEWSRAWNDGVVKMPEELAGAAWANAITGERVAPERRDGEMVLPLARLLATCPVALLIAEDRR